MKIIELAKEAGFGISNQYKTPEVLDGDGYGFITNEIERFAALVAEATKAKYEKRFDEVFGELIEKIKGGMSAESAIRSLK